MGLELISGIVFCLAIANAAISFADAASKPFLDAKEIRNILIRVFVFTVLPVVLVWWLNQ